MQIVPSEAVANLYQTDIATLELIAKISPSNKIAIEYVTATPSTKAFRVVMALAQDVGLPVIRLRAKKYDPYKFVYGRVWKVSESWYYEAKQKSERKAGDTLNRPDIRVICEDATSRKAATTSLIRILFEHDYNILEIDGGDPNVLRAQKIPSKLIVKQRFKPCAHCGELIISDRSICKICLSLLSTVAHCRADDGKFQKRILLARETIYKELLIVEALSLHSLNQTEDKKKTTHAICKEAVIHVTGRGTQKTRDLLGISKRIRSKNGQFWGSECAFEQDDLLGRKRI